MILEMKEEYPDDQTARQMILEVGRRMYQNRYVASNDGNISCKVSKDTIWVTPTGVSKGFMQEKDLIKMNLDGEIIEGIRKPSSEIRMHLRVYQEDNRVKSVVHAHPKFATLFAIANKPIDSRILPEGIVQLGVVPCAKTVIPGTQDVPDSIAPYVNDYNAVLLGNHGVLTWSEEGIMQAYYRLETVEYFAEIILYANLFFGDKVNRYTDEQVDQLIEIRNKLGIHRGGRPT
ncbi:MAG: class II aldolase/adducin family protein [Bilifractor sp.]|nr:class II aldolase/adducin family protein [Lachnospiraceae bacterium]MDY2836841.1 class II aldolase/adducin family protein [Bilifractor sp.]